MSRFYVDLKAKVVPIDGNGQFFNYLSSHLFEKIAEFLTYEDLLQVSNVNPNYKDAVNSFLRNNQNIKLTEKQIYDGLEKMVDDKCCYGKAPLRGIVIGDVVTSSTYHVSVFYSILCKIFIKIHILVQSGIIHRKKNYKMEKRSLLWPNN